MDEGSSSGGFLKAAFWAVAGCAAAHVGLVAVGLDPLLHELGHTINGMFTSEASAQTLSAGYTSLSESFSVNDCIAAGGHPHMTPEGPSCHVGAH